MYTLCARYGSSFLCSVMVQPGSREGVDRERINASQENSPCLGYAQDMIDLLTSVRSAHYAKLGEKDWAEIAGGRKDRH